jgi:hypothetical protein
VNVYLKKILSLILKQKEKYFNIKSVGTAILISVIEKENKNTGMGYWETKED